MTSKEQKNGDAMGDMGKLYDRQAPAFADKSANLVWWTTLGEPAFGRHLEELFQKDGIQVLDLGSASGRVVSFLIGKGIPAQNITGIEISPDQVAIAKKRIPGATFMVGDITTAQLDNDRFNLVTSNMVLEFLNPTQLTQAMENTYRWLKPGGTFFFITTHPDKMRATSGLDKPGVFTVQFPWGGEGPNYYRTVDDFRKAVEEAGFSIEALEELNLPREAESIDPQEYKRYMQYPNTRLVVKATKPVVG